LKALLRTDSGQIVREFEEQRSSNELQGQADRHVLTAVFPLNALAPGSYVVHVEARANIGDRPVVSRNVAIRVR